MDAPINDQPSSEDNFQDVIEVEEMPQQTPEDQDEFYSVQMKESRMSRKMSLQSKRQISRAPASHDSISRDRIRAEIHHDKKEEHQAPQMEVKETPLHIDLPEIKPQQREIELQRKQSSNVYYSPRNFPIDW